MTLSDETSENGPAPRALLALLTAVTALGSVSVSLYVPSLPAISAALGTDAATARLTLTAFLATFAASQLVYGPLSDIYGRRPPILVGSAIYVAGSLACVAAPSIAALIAARLLQAAGAAAGPALGRAIVRDSVPGDRLAPALAVMASVIALSPTLGPVAGGIVESLAGWRANFALLALLGLILGLSLVSMLRETLRPGTARPSGLLAGYARLLGDRAFMVLLICGGLLMAGNFAWVAAGPFILIQTLRVSPASYGFYNILVGGGYAVGAMAVILAGHRFSSRAAVLIGAFTAIGGALALLGVTSGNPEAWSMASAMAIFCVGLGIAVPSSAAAALARHPKEAGAAASLIGALQIAIGAMGSAFASASLVFGASGLAFIVAGAAIASAACLIWLPLPAAEQSPSSADCAHAAASHSH